MILTCKSSVKLGRGERLIEPSSSWLQSAIFTAGLKIASANLKIAQNTKNSKMVHSKMMWSENSIRQIQLSVPVDGK